MPLKGSARTASIGPPSGGLRRPLSGSERGQSLKHDLTALVAALPGEGDETPPPGLGEVFSRYLHLEPDGVADHGRLEKANRFKPRQGQRSLVEYAGLLGQPTH